jgi:hypothetical protein
MNGPITRFGGEHAAKVVVPLLVTKITAAGAAGAAAPAILPVLGAIAVAAGVYKVVESVARNKKNED